MMRIGINARCLRSATFTGVEHYVSRLVQALVEVAPEQEYVLFMADHSASLNIPCHQSILARQVPGRTGNPLGGLIWEHCALPQAAARDRVDVLHGPFYTVPLAGKFPRVATVHDLGYRHYPDAFSRRFRWYHTLALPTMLRRCAMIIAASEYTKADVVQYCDVCPDRIRVIYQAAHPSFHRVEEGIVRAFRTRYGLDMPYLLFVSGVFPVKNILRMLRAFALLRERTRFDGRLVLIGKQLTSWMPQYRRAVVELGLEGTVLAPGYVTHEDLRALYSGAEALVYPPLIAGFGVPPLEAMACGCPVVASKTSAIPEVVGDAAVLVDPANTESIAYGMAQVLEDRALRAKLIARGFEHVKTFSWEQTARKTLEVYRAAIEAVTA